MISQKIQKHFFSKDKNTESIKVRIIFNEIPILML